MIHALVADDHPFIRSGLRHALAQEPGIGSLVEAESGDEALARISDRRWDIVILDISMPGRSGLEVIPDIRRKYPRLAVLILSAYSDIKTAIRAMNAGADGYLVKSETPGELIQAIREVTKGRKYVSPSLASQLVAELADRRTTPSHERLSEREYQVVCRIASGARVSDVARAMGLSVKTISTYRSRALEKMGMRNNAELTRYAIRNGLTD